MKKSNKLLIALLIIILLVPAFAFIGAETQIKEYIVDNYPVKETYYLAKSFNQIIVDKKYFLNIKMKRTNKKAVTKIFKNKDELLVTINKHNYKIKISDQSFIVDKIKINKINYLSFQKFLINKNNQNIILLWDYSNINIIKGTEVKKIKLIDEDYNFKLATTYNEKFLYFMLDINDYNKVKVVDINNYKVMTIKLNYKLSSNTKIIKNKDFLYLHDLDNNNYYQFKNNQIHLLQKAPNINNKIFNNQLYINNNEYGYYKLQNDIIYNKINNQTLDHYIYKGTGIKNMEVIDDSYYFIEGNKLKQITNNTISTLILYDELSYNKTKLIFVIK